ncbi:MAG TPA: hypothetical protein VMS01_15835 [Stellaceae bacterium]|jgi:NAD-dependent SIR2 family protein deacetylase|nr:hypothetical protein [Stellaceae bacterium]
MIQNVNIDRAAIRSMVEEHWRSFLAVARDNPQIGKDSILRFQERIRSTASLMQPDQARVFIQAVEEEGEILFTEYGRNPDDLKQRLGLSPRFTNPVVTHQQQGLGEMVVRTAIRATVWESVFGLFRLFR